VAETFQEISTSSKTLHVDCSASGALFPHTKKIFDGKRINLCWMMLPSPGLNSSAIAAVELLHPRDEERKNLVCRPMTVPELASDFLPCLGHHFETMARLGEELGFSWMRSHPGACVQGLSTVLRGLWLGFWNQEKFLDKISKLTN
jgi:hypothetical protein